MSQFDQQWQALVNRARQAPDSRDTNAPFGFAARVVAQSAGAYGTAPWAALERFAVRGFLAASACCVAMPPWGGRTSSAGLTSSL